ncbi:MAG: sulfotransferase [Halothece sp.]
MSNIRPNLFIIGAMKAGTTSLHEYIGEHPEIYMSAIKEPSHFSQRNSYAQGNEHYLDLFRNAEGYPIIGESSTQYAKAPFIQGVPERIYTFNPEAKIIYIMRDPIERAISHYWFNWQNHGEKRSMSTAIKDDRCYTDISNYAMQLSLYAKVFDWSHIKVVTTEELNTHPVSTIQNIYRWLGVNDQFIPANPNQQYNITPREIFRANRIPDSVGNFLRSNFYHNIRRYIPNRFKKYGKAVIQERIDRKQASKTELEFVVPYLRSVMQNQVKELETMLERDFLVWTTFYNQI